MSSLAINKINNNYSTMRKSYMLPHETSYNFHLNRKYSFDHHKKTDYNSSNNYKSLDNN